MVLSLLLFGMRWQGDRFGLLRQSFF